MLDPGPVLTLLIPGRHAKRRSAHWRTFLLEATRGTRKMTIPAKNTFLKFMHLVRQGIGTTSESLPCQSRVARQTLSNLIVLHTKLKTLIQTSRFCRAYVELNSRIKFGTGLNNTSFIYVLVKVLTLITFSQWIRSWMRLIWRLRKKDLHAHQTSFRYKWMAKKN